MSCVLRATGELFDVGAFLADSPLGARAVHEKTESPPRTGATGRPGASGGLVVTVSTAASTDLARQIDDAIDFLDEHEDELRRLGRFPGVSSVCLGFGVEWRRVAAQTDEFPSDLLWRAGALDISLQVTYYAPADES
jgi:hypothetical protein